VTTTSENRPWIESPWDARAFGVPTYEVTAHDPRSLARLAGMSGHFTAKVPPRADAAPLRQAGFYYCDTLIEPWGGPDRLRPAEDPRASFVRDMPLEILLPIGHGAFYGRYHRDPAISRERADARYDQWLAELHGKGAVYGLLHDGRPAGYIAALDGMFVLHAMSPEHRGRGLARAFWTLVIRDRLARGEKQIHSSVSAGNLPIVNLYASLGFSFRNPLDVYHAWFPPPGGPARIE